MENSSPAFLQAIYLDATNTIRHYDAARTSFGQMFSGLLSFLSALAVAAKSTDLASSTVMAAAAFTTLLALTAILIVQRFGALIDLQRARANAALDQFAAIEDVDLRQIAVTARQRTQIPLAWIRLQHLWLTLFALFALGNCLLLATLVYAS